MKNRFSLGMAVLMAAILLYSCGRMPQAGIDQARSAIDSARIAGAEVYFPSEFASLQDSMNAAMILVEAQGSRMIKNYGDAVEKLNDVTVHAKEVTVLTENRKDELRQEIRTILADIRTLLDKNKDLIAQAPKGKEGTAALQAINAELAAVESSIAVLENQEETGDLTACHSSALASREKAASVHEELSVIIARYNRARR